MKNRKEIENLILNDKEFTLSSDLKEKIMSSAMEVEPLSTVEKKEIKPVNFKYFRKIVATCAVFLLFIMGVSAVGLYNEDYESIYIDINPSVELVVNRFDKVNKVICYNDDARELIKDTSIKGKNSKDGVCVILDKLNEKNYINEEDEVFISTYTKKEKKNDNLLKEIDEKVQEYSNEKGYKVKFNNNKLTKEDKQNAKDKGVSPMKYKLISGIIEKDATYNIESLKDAKMKDLKELYNEIVIGEEKIENQILPQEDREDMMLPKQDGNGFMGGR